MLKKSQIRDGSSACIRRVGFRVAVSALVAAPLIACGVPVGEGQARASDGCLGEDGATVEEALVADDVPQEILSGSAFTRAVEEFTRELCAVSGPDEAATVVEDRGDALWRAAVERVQESGDVEGDLSAGDDRPLYWARLGMTGALNRWEPDFELTKAERAELVADLERRSRGQNDADFPQDSGGAEVTRVVVTGFDPFLLDIDDHHANPSGAAALALDGVVIETEEATVVIEAMLFPVRWRDFTEGMVERALLPHYTGDRPADVVITLSQGGDEGFALEAHNSAWRGGAEDNESEGEAEMIPILDGLPTLTPQPQWSDSSLDHAAIIEATDEAPFSVFDNPVVMEIPEGGTEEGVSLEGPTPGSQARWGSGGDYLSNEIAYRNTLLRDATEQDIPAGHVHTPPLLLDTEEGITDADFEAHRAAIVDQTKDIIVAAARA